MDPKFAQLFVSVLVLFAQLLSLADGREIGVNYGLVANNLPPPKEVIELYKTSKIEYVRIFEPLPKVLQALRGSGLFVSIGPRNEDIASMAAGQEAANAWVNTNIVPYKNDVLFKWIGIGNEVIPGPLGANVPAAIDNVRNALKSTGLTGIKVTTVLPATALGVSFPPSAGAFASGITEIMVRIATRLAQQDAPLMVNVYPYFAYSSNPVDISANYTFFTSAAPVVVDGSFQYFNLFDAMIDAFNAALEKINHANVKLVVSESGWPTKGNEPFTNVPNAQTYNKNLLNHVTKQGTPRRPNYIMPLFFFAMFNENLKENTVEQNFGFFFPNKQPVYPFW